MGPIPSRVLARRVRRLDPPDSAAFVAALWTASGWAVEREGTVIEARRANDELRIEILRSQGLLSRWREPRTDTEADAVIVPRRSDGDRTAGGDARSIDADALRERLLFGVDPTTADELCREHLGCPARDARWTGEQQRTATRRITARSVVGAIALTIGALLLVVAIGPAALTGTGLDVHALSGAGNSSSLDGVAGSSAALPQPTCEREPGEVAVTVANVLEPPENGSSGMHVFWQFTDPEIRETHHYRGFRGYYEGPRFEPLRQADQVVLDHVVYLDDGARAVVIAPTDDGIGTFVFTLGVSEIDGQDCWRIQSVEPA